jgi:hypothetical protein
MNLRIALLSLLITASGVAGDTAYSALRAVSARHGESALSRVLEVRGGKGTWKIFLADKRVHTGVREIQVVDGRILSDRMVMVERRGNGPINVNELNLDSDGALVTVSQEVGQPVSEDLIHYTLSNGTDGSTPIWTVAIRHQREGEISSVQIAADTGAVLAKSLRSAPQNMELAGTDGTATEKDSHSSEVTETDRDGIDQSTRKKNTSSKPILREVPEVVERFADRIESRGIRLRRLLPF